MEEQMSIASILENYKNPLSVLHNSKPVSMEYTEIFDPKLYSSIKAVTYVASARFLYDVAKEFRQVDIIMGIPDSSLQKAVKRTLNKYFIKGNMILLDDRVPDEAKNRICDGTFNLYFANLQGKKLPVFHSKIFILENDETKKTRVILGSVNLTNSAFSNNVEQYEEAIIYDDEPDIYDYYCNRYKYIYSLSDQKYVSDEAKRAYKEKNKDELINVVKAENDCIITELSEGDARKVCNNDEVLRYATTTTPEDRREEDGENRMLEIMSVVSQKSGDKYKLKTPKQIQTQKKIISTVNRNATEESKGRYQLNYDKESGGFYETVSGKSGDYSEPIGRPSSDEVKAGLENILAFAEAYKSRIVNSDTGDENAAGIIESILYALESPFLWMLREQESNTPGGKRENIPLVLYVQSEPFGGKSNLAEYISKLLTGRDEKSDYYSGKQLGSGSMIFENISVENNVFPYILDDGPKDLLTNSKTVENLKNVANTREGICPALITTTNYKKTLSSDVSRRVYRIPLPGTFKDSKNKSENDAYFTEIFGNCSNAVLHEVLYRISNLSEPMEMHNPDGNIDDFLYPVRSIIEQMAEEYEIELPEYFPRRSYAQMLSEQSMKVWRDYYGWQKRDCQNIGYSKKLDRIKFNLSGATAKTRKNLENSIDPILMEPASGADTIILKATPFFEWIGESKPNFWLARKMPW